MASAHHALIALLFASSASVACAQAPAPSAPMPAAATQPAAPAAANPAAPQKPTAAAVPLKPAAAAPAATPPAQEAYTYRADGRRDPFLNLRGTGVESKLTSRKGEGPTGMTIGEISVRGVMQSRGALVAMIQGPDNKTYLVHQGDKLLDGTIKTVTPQGLVIVQEVNDPLSLIKTREVRKLLRSLEDAKE
jgi:Tfp pilus assembly protein PilP